MGFDGGYARLSHYEMLLLWGGICYRAHHLKHHMGYLKPIRVGACIISCPRALVGFDGEDDYATIGTFRGLYWPSFNRTSRIAWRRILSQSNNTIAIYPHTLSPKSTEGAGWGTSCYLNPKRWSPWGGLKKNRDLVGISSNFTLNRDRGTTRIRSGGVLRDPLPP